jgi:hypothetical protein
MATEYSFIDNLINHMKLENKFCSYRNIYRLSKYKNYAEEIYFKNPDVKQDELVLPLREGLYKMCKTVETNPYYSIIV